MQAGAELTLERNIGHTYAKGEANRCGASIKSINGVQKWRKYREKER